MVISICGVVLLAIGYLFVLRFGNPNSWIWTIGYALFVFLLIMLKLIF